MARPNKNVGKYYTKSEVAKIVAMRTDGLTFRAIADDLGRSRQGVTLKYHAATAAAPQSAEAPTTLIEAVLDSSVTTKVKLRLLEILLSS